MRNTLRRQPDAAAYLKALLRTWRYRTADALGLLKPLKLRLGLTNRCNSRCIMCNVWKMTDNEATSIDSELRTDEYERIFKVNAGFFSQLNHVALTGGEPTLRRDLVEICRIVHAHDPRISLSFNSNGFSTARVLKYTEAILEFHPRLSVMISLDGLGEHHDVVRGVPNVFPRVLATIEELDKLRQSNARMKLEINYVMTPRNVEDCSPVYRYCRDHRIEFNPIYAVQGELYDNEKDDNVTLPEEARQAYIEQFKQILCEDDSLQTREILDQLLNRPRDFRCWAARITILIEENGNVFPNGGCPGGFLMGNLRDYGYSFRSLLAGDQARRVLARAKSCRTCRLSCETMTTLQHPEALSGYRKSREMPY